MPHKQTDPGVSVNPDTISFNQAVQLLPTDELYQVAKAFYEGDHWQKGEAWVGPTVEEGEDAAVVMGEIEAELVSHPAIEEVVERHMNATVGGEPTATLVPRRVIPTGEEPTEEEQEVMDRARAAIRAWWDEKEVLDKIQQAVIDLQLGGRGLLRLFVPEGELEVVDGEEDPRVPGGDLEEQLQRIWVTWVEAEQGVVIRDPITMKQLSVYVYEVVDVLTGKPTQIAELSYLNDEGKTIIKTVRQEQATAGAAEPTSSVSEPMDLNKRLTLYQMRSKRIITKPVLDNQKLLNMALTMMGRNVVLGGFLERVILNGEMPGKFELNPVTGKKEFIPDPYKTGLATTQYIGGVQIGKNQETGDPIIANPDVKWREPVPVKTFVDTAEAAYRNILHGARQLHVIISGDAIASGESRKQARDDYEKSLKRTKSKVDAAGTWLVDTALSMAATFAGQPDMFKDFRVVFDAKIDAGPLSAEDRQAMQTEVTNNVRSRKSYMIEARITDDPTAEKAEILKEQNELPGVQREMPGLSDRRNINQNPPMNNPPEPDNNLPAN